MNPISEFTAGPGYLLRGFAWLGEPALRRYVIVPVLINVLLIAGLMTLLGWRLDDWLNAWLGGLPDWLSWLEGVLWWILLILASLVFCYFFTLLATFIASPFNGMLSARVERLVTGTAPESGLSRVGEIGDAVFGEIERLGYYLGRLLTVAFISLLLFFIPVANLAIAPLWFVFGAFMLAFEYLDNPMGNRGMTLDAKLAHLRARRWRHLGFGSVVTLATAIPLANLIIMPAAVIGATLMYLDNEKENPNALVGKAS